MRKVSFTINMSLDGYCDHTLGEPSEALMQYFVETMDEVDLLFYGRIMYELMFPYWTVIAQNRSGSPAELQFAEKLASIDKVVVSRSLTTVERNVTIVRNDPVTALLQLKKQQGGTISIDTISMLPELITADLIDEFQLVVHPVIAGSGRHLLNAGSLSEMHKLQLVQTKTFENGCIALHYRRKT